MHNRPLSLEDAAELFRQQQPQSAIRICEQLLSDREAAPAALELLAEAHAATGRTDLAIRALQRLVYLQPDNVGGLRRLGYLQLSVGAAADASVSLTAALRLDTGHARTLNNLGQAQIRLGRTAEAIGSLEAAIRAAPDYAIAHFNLGSAMLQRDQPRQALECFARAARIDRAFAEAQVACGNVLLQLQRPADALSHFALALDMKPHYEALLGRAAALGDLARPEESIRTYRLAASVRPDLAEPLWRCARILLELGGRMRLSSVAIAPSVCKTTASKHTTYAACHSAGSGNPARRSMPLMRLSQYARTSPTSIPIAAQCSAQSTGGMLHSPIIGKRSSSIRHMRKVTTTLEPCSASGTTWTPRWQRMTTPSRSTRGMRVHISTGPSPCCWRAISSAAGGSTNASTATRAAS